MISMPSARKTSSKVGSETLVPIMDEEADRCVPVFAGVGEVAGDLRAPGHVRRDRR